MEPKDRIELLLQKYCRSNLFSASTRRFLSTEIVRVLNSDDDVDEMLSPRFNSNLQSKVEEQPTVIEEEQIKVEKPKKAVKKVEKPKKAVKKVEKPKKEVKSESTAKKVKTTKKTHKKSSPLKGFGKRKKANTLR